MTARKHGAQALTFDQIIVLIYRRVSKKDQASQGLSLPTQLAACHGYSGKQTDWISGEEFSDVQSGRKVSREGYQALLLAVRGHALAGLKVVVLVARVDRLGRDMEESARAWKELDALGAEVHSVREGGVASWTTFHLLSLIAADESRRIGSRVKDVWANIEQARWHRPGRVAWGFRFRAATPEERGEGAPKSVLEPDETQGKYARELWQRYADGASVEALARWAATLPEAVRGERVLRHTAVRGTLRLPVYIGRLGGAHDIEACVASGERCEVLDAPRGRWEPLISDDLWMRAHAQWERTKRLPAQASGRYLLSGFIRCQSCGGRMAGNPGNRRQAAARSWRREPRDAERYICTERTHGDLEARANPCYATADARRVEAPVLATVRELLERVADPALRVRLRNRAQQKIRAEGGEESGAALVAGFETKLRAAHRMLVEASQRYFRGEISQLAYKANEDLLTQEIESLQAEVERVRSRRKAPAPMGPEMMLQVADGFRGLTTKLEDKGVGALRWRGVLDAIVQEVTPVKVGRGQYEVKLTLTPFGNGLLAYVCEGEVTANLVAVRQFATTNCRTATLALTA